MLPKPAAGSVPFQLHSGLARPLLFPMQAKSFVLYLHYIFAQGSVPTFYTSNTMSPLRLQIPLNKQNKAKYKTKQLLYDFSVIVLSFSFFVDSFSLSVVS